MANTLAACSSNAMGGPASLLASAARRTARRALLVPRGGALRPGAAAAAAAAAASQPKVNAISGAAGSGGVVGGLRFRIARGVGGGGYGGRVFRSLPCSVCISVQLRRGECARAHRYTKSQRAIHDSACISRHQAFTLAHVSVPVHHEQTEK